MPRYTQESRERVRDAVDFAEIVGARTELRRAGQRRLQGLCPFHEERTPSFGIDPVEKLYHCFGCGAGGDVFSFVMATEGLDFTAALESLAERAGIELEREAEDPRDAARRVRRERLLALLERTAAWYVRLLWESADAAPAREYLAGRGLQEATLREFRVGWAPDAWDRVAVASRRADYDEEELLAAGLASRRRSGSGLVDRFRGRITFPLCDERGRVLGFGARRMTREDGPKYLNTPEGELFHKGDLLYGADLARAAAARVGRVVLVEGYTDAIALRQAGVTEVVGSMGTALTDKQVGALARLAPLALFCQDPDSAGQEAVARSIGSLREENQRRAGRGVEFRIVRLPGGEDPADVVQREGADAMHRLLDEAVPVARFEVERALDRGGDRDTVLAEIAALIAPLPPSVLREELVRLTASRLGLGESLVAEALARPRAPAGGRPGGGAARRSGERDRERGRRDGRGRGGDGSRGGGFSRFRNERDSWGAWDKPEEATAAAGAQAALDRREQSERAFLALCLALPDEGERRLAEADLDDLFASAATRRVAAYLRGRLRAPAGALPAGDEPMARLVAELVIRAGQLEATPGKLELEALQLELHRLERHIASARISGGEGVGALAVERQRVLDAIRHRLT